MIFNYFKKYLQRNNKNKIILENNEISLKFYQEIFQLSLYNLINKTNKNQNKNKNSFHLFVSTSTIPNSNNGVFIKGNISKGDIISLYPGVYYPPLPLNTVGSSDGDIIMSISDIRHMYEDNVYNIHLNNYSGYINGLNVEKTIFQSDSNNNSENMKLREFNPYAVGQYINHPNPSNHPNVKTIDFLWKDVYNFCYTNHPSRKLNLNNSENNPESNFIDLDLLPSTFTFEEYCKIVPNILGTGPWYVDSNGQTVLIEEGMTDHSLPGLAFVALEDIIDGSELFFDYKLHPSHRPDWYHVPKKSLVK